MNPPSRPIDVTVVLLDDGHASTAVGPLEVFGAAGTLWNALTHEAEQPYFRVSSASVGGRAVKAEGPLRIEPDRRLEDVRKTDLVFVPSAGLDLEGFLVRHRPVIEFLRRQRRRGARIAGVCSGVALLAASGILDGKVATAHWALVDGYAERFPNIDWRPQDLVTEADGIYCGGGVYAALDLALYLVERLVGRAEAVRCAKALLIEMPRECQAGFAVLPMSREHDDERVQRAEQWIHRHCREEFRFDSLARELGMSPRTFMRRFKAATGHSAVDYLQRLRVHAARRMLEEDGKSVQEVCSLVGYDDAAFFRRLFKRHTGLAPAAYRQRFSRSLDTTDRPARRAR